MLSWLAVIALAAMLSVQLVKEPANAKQGRAGASASVEGDGFDVLDNLTLLLGDSAHAAPPTPRMPVAPIVSESQQVAEIGDKAMPSVASREARSQNDLIQRWLDVANDIDPELGAKLTALSQKSPAAFDRAMRRGNVGRNLNSMALLKQRDPDLYQTKVSLMMQTVQVNRIAAQLREAVRNNSTGQIDTLKAKLKTALEHQLGTEIKDKGDYICRIEEQLERAREDLIREAVNFPHTIEARMAAHMKPRAAEAAELDDLAAPDEVVESAADTAIER
jgi:hypothetical protein